MKDSSITNTIHNLIKEFEFRDLFNLNPIFKAEIMSYIDLIKKSSDSNTLSYQKTFEIKIKNSTFG